MRNRRIEYVFGPPQPESGHAIGVGALRMNYNTILAPDSHGTLFSGGRDGRVNAWTLRGDEATSGLMQTCHTNTVSALMPFSADTVVSCSTDTTVKVWNVKTNNVVKLGHHFDYVECLTHCSDTCVASGGLDDRVMGWDVNSQKQAFELAVNHSVYTISSVRNSIVITGSPDGAVRIWDPRQQKQVMKLAGHTDSVRSILVSDDRDSLLSGSSDGTAVLWSLRYGRALKTMSKFDSSIWVLRQFEKGYIAGDKNGSLYMSSSLESEPQAVYRGVLPHGLKGLVYDEKRRGMWMSTPFNPDIKNLDLKGNCRQTLPGHKGLRKHRLLNDKRRALVADTDRNVQMFDLVGAKPLPFYKQIKPEQNVDEALDDLLAEVNTMDVLDNWCQIEIKAGRIYVILDRQSVNNTEVYLDDLSKYVTQEPAGANGKETPFASPIHTPLISPVNSGFIKQHSPAVSRVTSAQSLDNALSRTNTKNKRNSRLGSGRGKVDFYDPDDESSSDEEEKVKEKPKPTRPLSQLGPQPGQISPLSGPVDPPKQASSALAGPSPKMVETEEPADENTADDELRINLGNFVLENLLRGVIDNLLKQYAKTNDAHTATLHPRASSLGLKQEHNHHHPPNLPHHHHVQSTHDAANTSSHHQTSMSSKRKGGLFSKLFGKSSSKHSSKHSSLASTNLASNHASAVPTPSSAPSPSPAEKGMTPQQLKEQRLTKLLKEPDSKTFTEAWDKAYKFHSFQVADPEAPITEIISRQTRIIITESEPGAGAPTEIYSTTVGALINNDSEDRNMMAELPGWVGDAVLLGKLHLKRPTKIGFSVVPLSRDLPDFSTDDTRLTAIAMLRMRKIMAYIVGQLQKQKILSAQASSYQPEELIRLSCNNTDIDPLTTLATVRTRIWPHGGDVSLGYSLKKRV